MKKNYSKKMLEKRLSGLPTYYYCTFSGELHKYRFCCERESYSDCTEEVKLESFKGYKKCSKCFD